MHANTDYSTSTVSSPYFFPTQHPSINRTPTKENPTATSSPSLSTTTTLQELSELPEDQLLISLTSSALPSHFAILEKVAAAITQKQEEKAVQLALSNDTPLPALPLINSNQASVIIKDLSKKINVNIPEINCCVEFTPLEFFFYLLEKSSESDSKLPEILDIECIGYHVTSLLPGIANQIAQILLETSAVSLHQDVINKLEGNGNDLAYRIKIPLSKVDFFQHYSEAFVRFLSEKAIHQNKLNVPLPKVEEFLEAQCTVHLPKIFYNNCYASISIPNQQSQIPYKLVIAQHMGESALLKNTLHLSIKPLVEKLKNLENQPQIQTSFIEKEASSFIHLSNDAQSFWNAQFDRLPNPIAQNAQHFEARKTLFDKAINALATKELWLACVDRLTGRLHINEPIYSENQYAGWLQLICETLNGARPASLGMEKRLVEASFDILENKEVSHPLEIQKILNSCLSEEQWEALTISFLKTICANNFELSIAMLAQTCITLQRTKGKDHIASLWASMNSHLSAIQPKNNSSTSCSIWSHIYEIMSQEDKPFDAVVALLETHAFLALSQETIDSKIKCSLCLYEGKPAFRITDGLYCLHLLTNFDSFWETFHTHTKTIESNKNFNEISSLITSKKIPEVNNTISRNKELLGLDYSAIHKTVEAFISSTTSPHWKIFAIKTLLAFHTLDAALLPWKTAKLMLQTLSSIEENTEQQELMSKVLHLSTFNKYSNTEIPSEVLWAYALMKNIDPQHYQKDVLQAYNLWTSYEKTTKPCDKTLELKTLIKIAAYRPDLAANMFQKLLTKDFFDVALHEQKIKEYITSICRSLEATPTHKNEKTHLSLQNIVDTFQNSSINTWMFKQLMIGTDSCNVLSEKTMNLLLKSLPYVDLNNTDMALKYLTEDKLKQFLESVTSSNLNDSVILDYLNTIFTLRKSFCANTKVSSDFDKKLIRAIIHYANTTQSHAPLLLKASQLATASNEPSLSTQASFIALAIEHASKEYPFLLLEEFKKANVEEQQTIIKQILDSTKKAQAFEVQLLLITATCRPDLAAEMFQLLLNKNFFRGNILQNEMHEYVSSLCQSLKTSPVSHTEKLYSTLQKIIDIFPSMETHVFGQLIINTASDTELPPKTRELLLKTLPYAHITDTDLFLKNISIDKLEQLVEGILSSNQNPEFRYASLDNLLTLRGKVADNTEKSSAFDKKLIEMIILHANLTPSHCSLLVKACQRATDSNLLSLSSQAVLTAMKIGGNFEENHILSCILLNNFEKGSLKEQQTLIKQILNVPNAQKILESTFKESFTVFFNPSLLQSFTSTFAKDQEQQPLARQFFKFLIHLCKLNQATDNYDDLLPLAHVCLLKTPSPTSAFSKCLFEFRPELLAAASADPAKNSNLITFFKQCPIPIPKDSSLTSEQLIKDFQKKLSNQAQLITIVSNVNEIISLFQPFANEKSFQKSLESINKLINPLTIDEIDKILTLLQNTIFELSKMEKNEILSYAIHMWDHIESIFVRKMKGKKSEVTLAQLQLYKVLFSGLKKSRDFDKKLNKFLSQFKNYSCSEIRDIFTSTVIKYTSYLPLDIQEKYTQALADTYIPLFIERHTRSPKSVVPHNLLVGIGKQIPLDACLNFISKLEVLNTNQAFSHALSLAEGLLKYRSPLPQDVMKSITALLKAVPFSSAKYLMLCLKAGKESLPSITREEIWKKLNIGANLQFQIAEKWKPSFITLCKTYFDLIFYQAADSPVVSKTAESLLELLSYLCVAQESFPSKYVEKAIDFWTNKTNFKTNAYPTLTPQQIRLNLLQRIVNRPVQTPELFTRMLTNAVTFLKQFPEEPLNSDQLIKILFDLSKRNVSDSCFASEELIYELYHDSFNDLVTEVAEKRALPNTSVTVPYITCLILNAQCPPSPAPEFIKKSIEEYLTLTTALYEESKKSSHGNLKREKEGFLHFRRLQAIAQKGIQEDIFNKENYCLLLNIADSIMRIAYDYRQSPPLFEEMSKTAIQLATLKTPSTKQEHDQLKIQTHQWNEQLRLLKPQSSGVISFLLTKMIVSFFQFAVNIVVNDLDELQNNLETFHKMLIDIPPNRDLQLIGYERMLFFSAFIIPDSYFTAALHKEYADINTLVASIIQKISEKGKIICPSLLTLLYTPQNYKQIALSTLPLELKAYFEELKKNYIAYKEQTDSKCGYVPFKRLSKLLLDCLLKKIPKIHREQYVQMTEFLTTIANEYTNTPSIYLEMEKTLKILTSLINKLPLQSA